MNITFDKTQERVESAGKTLMMMPPVRGPRGHVSSWPEYIRERDDTIDVDVIGREIRRIFDDKKTPWPKPTPVQITELDEVLIWMTELAVYCNEKKIPWIYKTVWLGMLHHPVSGKRLYTWKRIGNYMDRSDQTAKNWYDDGISIITRLRSDAYLREVIG